MKIVPAAAALCLILLPIASRAAPLPARVDPLDPFPHVRSEAPTVAPVAPGITSAEYDFVTDLGPIVARVVAIEPNRTDVHVGSVLAANALASNGETISSMARRTDAVAGINADYFDIGNTNAPTNIVVRDGRLLRTPRKRYSLVIPVTGAPQIVENAFTGEVQLGDRTVGLDAINEMPPPGGGTALLTPEFGEVSPEDNLTLVAMTPTAGVAPFTSYRVTSIADNTVKQSPGYYLAIGINAYGSAGVPNPGDTIGISGNLSPIAANQISAAVGGGPLILFNGAWYDDPDGPLGADYVARIPASGAAIEPDGTLLLIEIDGRNAERSIGVTRREFSAFMRAFGANAGLAFDGGGSSTIVERALGSRVATLQNHPSDGVERPVADGIFAYSTAPYGPASELISQPAEVRALPGARIDVHLAAIDRGDHAVMLSEPIVATVEPATLGTFRDGIFAARESGVGNLVMRSATLSARVPIDVFVGPSRLEILPVHPNAPVDGSVALSARAFDPRGYAIAIPDSLPWRTNEGRISDAGVLEGASHDADVSLTFGAAYASKRVTVGNHVLPLAFSPGAHFLTVPRDGEGGVTMTDDGGVELAYAIGPGERAAYAAADLALPNGTIALAFDVRDDGSQLKLRVALRNAINEQVLLTAATLDRPGWRHVTVALPENLAEPARLSALYVIGSSPAFAARGKIEIKNLRATVAGSP